MSEAVNLSKDERPKLICHVHPRYKAIRKPRPGCVLCHAMWQDKLVADERAKKIDDANKAAFTETSMATSTTGEGFAFFRWMIKWGYAYGSPLTNESAIKVWNARKLRR